MPNTNDVSCLRKYNSLLPEHCANSNVILTPANWLEGDLQNVPLRQRWRQVRGPKTCRGVLATRVHPACLLKARTIEQQSHQPKKKRCRFHLNPACFGVLSHTCMQFRILFNRGLQPRRCVSPYDSGGGRLGANWVQNQTSSSGSTSRSEDVHLAACKPPSRRHTYVWR